jgi:hypothetical protein
MKTLGLVIVLALTGGTLLIEHGRRVVIDAPAAAEALSPAAATPCPDNDTVPYSQSCIAYLKGATETGMRWRATAEPLSTPTPQ